MYKFLPVFLLVFGLQLNSQAQEQSPYSRYGLGDISPKSNIYSRGMGGVSAAVMDFQSINLTNPAALGGLRNTIFEIGAEADSRTLKTNAPVKRSTSYNALFSYLNLAFPVASKGMRKRNINWSMNLGLKPVSRIDYNIESNKRISGIDSVHTLYNGSGGINQVFAGTGFEFTEGTGHATKKIRVGINIGYMFGTKDYSTKIAFVNDTIDYYRSNSANNTHFGGMFLNGGIQFDDSIKNGVLRLGLYGNLQQRMNAKQDYIRETFSYDYSGGAYTVDSVSKATDVKGTIVFPSTIGFGLTYQDPHWTYGSDIEFTNWANYTFYRQPDAVQNSWVARAGAEYFPWKKGNTKNFLMMMRYRAGAYYGPDYVKPNTTSRPSYGFTGGISLPLMNRLGYEYQFAILHAGVEFGNRGTSNVGLRESTLKVSVGVSMSASWFLKRKYD
jgi:hypothetical protein